MKIRQLSLFLENRPGQLLVPCRVLGDAGIDILTMSLADTQQFGILRVVVTEPDRARTLLEQAGMVVNVTDVLAVEVPDRPGGLAEVLAAFDQAGLGVEYMYPFATRERGRSATLLFRLEEPDRAVEALLAKGVRLASSAELFARAKP
jgi:hypothetical protein